MHLNYGVSFIYSSPFSIGIPGAERYEIRWLNRRRKYEWRDGVSMILHLKFSFRPNQDNIYELNQQLFLWLDSPVARLFSCLWWLSERRPNAGVILSLSLRFVFRSSFKTSRAISRMIYCKYANSVCRLYRILRAKCMNWNKMLKIYVGGQ